MAVVFALLTHDFGSLNCMDCRIHVLEGGGLILDDLILIFLFFHPFYEAHNLSTVVDMEFREN